MNVEAVPTDVLITVTLSTIDQEPVLASIAIKAAAHKYLCEGHVIPSQQLQADIKARENPRGVLVRKPALFVSQNVTKHLSQQIKVDNVCQF